MVYTLGQAAKVTGKTKAAISKAIKRGRISGKKDDKGYYAIDPAELHRIYPAVAGEQDGKPSTSIPKETESLLHVRELETLLQAANQRIGDKDDQIGDLREDRDKWRQQATALLVDQRPKRFWWPFGGSSA